MVNRILFPFLLILLAFSLNSCFKNIGRQITAGVRDELTKSQLDSVAKVLSKSAAQGVLEVALNDSVQARLRQQVDSMAQVVSRQVGKSALHLRDSILLSTYTNAWLQSVINKAGANLQNRGNDFLGNIRGEETRLFVARLRDELLNDITLQRTAHFRDELLGVKTQILADSLAQRLARGLIKNQINPGTDKIIANLNKVTTAKIKDARRLAYLAGGVALLIAGITLLVYRQARKHKETLKIITKQIDKIPDQGAYDQLVTAIRQETETKGLEPHLQEILKEEHLYQQPAWQEKDYQVLNLISHYLHDIQNDKTGQVVLQDLASRAKSVNLDDQLQSLLKRTKPAEIYQPT